MNVILMTRKRVVEKIIPDTDPAMNEAIAEHPTALRTEFRSRWRRRGWGGVLAGILLFSLGIVLMVWFRFNPLWVIANVPVSLGAWFFWPLLMRLFGRGNTQRVYFRAAREGDSWEAFPMHRDLDRGLLRHFDAALAAVFPGLERSPGGAPRITAARSLRQMVEMSVEKRFVRKQMMGEMLKDPTTVMWAFLSLAFIVGVIIIVLTVPQAAADPGGTFAR